MNGFGPSLYLEIKASLLQFLLDRSDKLGDISVTRTLGLIQFLLDKIKLLPIRIFQGKILQLTLDGIESQTMGQGRIKERGLCRQPHPVGLRQLLAQSHQAKPIGDHQQDHPHVLGEREEQMMKILRINGRITGIQV